MRLIAASAVALLVLTQCGSEVAGGSNAEPAGSWEQLPDAPLSPRENAVAVAVGGRVLVVGGSDAPPCPPLADCVAPDVPALSDGAVFDPATDQWRQITNAPVPLAGSDANSTAVYGSSVSILIQGTSPAGGEAVFLSYDMDTDEWAELQTPPNAGEIYCCDLVAVGDRIVAYPGSDTEGETPDHIFDPATGEWSALPDDPLSPTNDREFVWSGTELIHFADPSVSSGEQDDQSGGVVAALDLDSGEWRTLPEAGAHVFDTVFVGGRVVNPWLGSSAPDPGPADMAGWIYDVPSGLSPLPDPPAESGVSSIGVIADGEAYFVEDYGWVLDLDAEEWLWIDPRPGADRGLNEPGGPYVSGMSTAAVGESMFAYGGVRWDDVGSDPEWLDEAWLWRP